MNDKELEELLTRTFSFVHNPPMVVKTRGGSFAIIFTMHSGGSCPIMGAWWSGEEWVPAKWLKNGRYPSINEKIKTTKLDLMIIQPVKKEYA